ncbi:hypothetical protein AVEN_157334-1 [Araneus ventricosus]|uniref:Uncharacterized protein n=1 Tax=Araneus ventricosus TaxID=182803 RepID=A0A4Y2TY45_ARAVE|nr:hypothetical protein AVEN_157334-1 [Araneus ventricosus]
MIQGIKGIQKGFFKILFVLRDLKIRAPLKLSNKIKCFINSDRFSRDLGNTRNLRASSPVVSASSRLMQCLRRKLESSKDPPCLGLNAEPLLVVVQKIGEVVPAQVSSSSSDICSKLRVTSQNSHCFASKRDLI